MREAGTWSGRVPALVIAVTLAGSAHAQGPAPPRPGGAGPGAATRAYVSADEPLPLDLPADPGAPVEEAQAHFRRGIQLYAAGNAASALVELRRAYSLVPSYRILFNLGQVAYQCGDHAAAFGYLTRYLTEGGAHVPEGRRKEVARDLADLRTSVGYLAIETRETGLRVTVDDVEVGSTPFAAPLPANVGRRRIEVLAPSGVRRSRIVDLAAGEILSVSFAAAPVTPVTAPAAPLPEIRPPPPPVITLSLPPPPPPSPAPPHVRATAPVPVAATPPSERPRRTAPWLTWTLAAIVAGGAGATGALAWSTSRTLHEKTATYPVTAGELQSLHDRERRYALASDGLLAGAVVLSALALYFTVSGSPASDDDHSGALTARASR